MQILKMTRHHEKWNGDVQKGCFVNVEIEFIMDFMFL